MLVLGYGVNHRGRSQGGEKSRAISEKIFCGWEGRGGAFMLNQYLEGEKGN